MKNSKALLLGTAVLAASALTVGSAMAEGELKSGETTGQQSGMSQEPGEQTGMSQQEAMPQGKKEQRRESLDQAKKRVEKLRQVSGQVLHTKKVEVRGADTENLIALIKTTKGDQRLVVDLGPADKFTGNQVKEGARIAAEGRVVQIRDRQFLAAQKVKIGDRIVQVERKAQSDQFRNSQRQTGEKEST